MKSVKEITKGKTPTKARRTSNGKGGAMERKEAVPEVEVYAQRNRFVLPKEYNAERVGRPNLITPLIVSKLEDAFCYDATVEEACLHAGISRSTYYDFIKEFPAFSDRVDELRQSPTLVLRKRVIRSSTFDADLALKYLERKRKVEFSTKTEVEHSGEVANKHYVDPDQAALIKNAMGNFARKVAKSIPTPS